MLLLAALHPPKRLAKLVRVAIELGLEPLVEAHSAKELGAALATDAHLIGINNRNLVTLDVDTSSCERLRGEVPDDRVVIAESGVHDAATVRRWRALGFDGALVGEDLMRSGSEPAAVEARVAALVGAGAVPGPGVDPAVDGRVPFVKICGLTEPAGLDAAIAAGADAIGLNFVPGTPRALEEGEAAALIASARASDAPGNGPLLVGVFADRKPAQVAAIAARLDLDAVQLHGSEPARHLDRIPLPVIKVLHIPAADDATASAEAVARQAKAYAAKPNLQAIILDTSDPRALGGTGVRASVEVARAVANQVPVILAGGSPLPTWPRHSWTYRRSASTSPAASKPRRDPRVGRTRTRCRSRSSSSARSLPAWTAPPSRPARARSIPACSKRTRPAAGASAATSAAASCPRR